MIEIAYKRSDTGNIWPCLAEAMQRDKYVGPFPPVSVVAVEDGNVIASFPIDLSRDRAKQMLAAFDEIEKIEKLRQENHYD